MDKNEIEEAIAYRLRELEACTGHVPPMAPSHAASSSTVPPMSADPGEAGRTGTRPEDDSEPFADLIGEARVWSRDELRSIASDNTSRWGPIIDSYTQRVGSSTYHMRRPVPSSESGRVHFWRMTTGQAILDCVPDHGQTDNIAVLSFANGSHPGGGYQKGAGSQEEELCRQAPGLFWSLRHGRDNGLYPFGAAASRSGQWLDPEHLSGVLITPVVFLRRGGRECGFPVLDTWRSFMVVSAAAPNRNARQFWTPTLWRESMSVIFCAPHAAAPDNPPTILILGAWGCGAFGNDPAVVAQYFAEAAREFAHMYRHVIFAVPDFGVDDNAYVFHEVLRTVLAD